MDKRFVWIIGIVAAIFLVRGCIQDGRRSQVRAIAKNRPGCVASSVYVSDDATFFSYETKNGKIRGFGVDWVNGEPRIWEIH